MRRAAIDLVVVSIPEFLQEGAAVADFVRPDQVMMGADEERATLVIRLLYPPFVRSHDRVLVTDVKALAMPVSDAGHPLQLLGAVEAVNERQSYPRWAVCRACLWARRPKRCRG